MTDMRPITPAGAGECPRLIAPGGPVTRAVAIMAANAPNAVEPQFALARLDLTGVAIGLGCVLAWVAPLGLVIGGVL